MNIGVIFAGGVGVRMHSKDKPKQFLNVYGKPVIIHTLERFEKCDEIDSIVISCVGGWIEYLQELISTYGIKKVYKIVKGGDTGQISIYNALCAAEELAKGEKSVVLIHDGVRPLITSELLKKNIQSVKKFGSAITTGIVKETVVECDETGDIITIPDRKNCRVAKAPESFWLDEIIEVERKAIEEGYTSAYDSCCLMSHYGYKLHIIDGAESNIKITTPEDIYSMRAFLESVENAQIYGM